MAGDEEQSVLKYRQKWIEAFNKGDAHLYCRVSSGCGCQRQATGNF